MDILDRVTSLNGSCVYNMKQDFRALDMAKKLMSKAGSLRRTLYKPGISAITKLLPSPKLTTPRCGFKVVK